MKKYIGVGIAAVGAILLVAIMAAERGTSAGASGEAGQQARLAKSSARDATASGTPDSMCTGTPFSQHQDEVTKQLSTAAPGVTVKRITDTAGNWISYYDIPSYSAVLDRIFYNRMQMNQKIMANPDGSHAQAISSDPNFHPSHTRPLMISNDGTLAYYVKSNPDDTADIYEIHLTERGPCKEIRLTSLNTDQDHPLQLSTTSMEKGKNVIAFANSNILRRVLEDGTALPEIKLPDAENDQPFHRIRLNPKFPHIVFYRRNQSGSHFNSNGLYVVDLNDPRVSYNVATEFSRIGHMLWSPDGLQIGFNAEDRQWHVADVVGAGGALKADRKGRFSVKTVGPRGADLLPQFCSWAPDGSLFVCMTRRTGSNSKIFLMSLDGRTQILAGADVEGRSEDMQGDSWAQFLGDNRHIIFHSNRTGRPEVYLIDNFNPKF